MSIPYGGNSQNVLWENARFLSICWPLVNERELWEWAIAHCYGVQPNSMKAYINNWSFWSGGVLWTPLILINMFDISPEVKFWVDSRCGTLVAVYCLIRQENKSFDQIWLVVASQTIFRNFYIWSYYNIVIDDDWIRICVFVNNYQIWSDWSK